MISYPGTPDVRLALERTRGDRAAARHLIRAHIMAEAERQAAIAGRSMKCESGMHADQLYGCANDGTTCICQCHDNPNTGNGGIKAS